MAYNYYGGAPGAAGERFQLTVSAHVATILPERAASMTRLIETAPESATSPESYATALYNMRRWLERREAEYHAEVERLIPDGMAVAEMRPVIANIRASLDEKLLAIEVSPRTTSASRARVPAVLIASSPRVAGQLRDRAPAPTLRPRGRGSRVRTMTVSL